MWSYIPDETLTNQELWCTRWTKQTVNAPNISLINDPTIQLPGMDQVQRNVIKQHFDESCEGDTNGWEFWKNRSDIPQKQSSNKPNNIILKENNEMIIMLQVCAIFSQYLIDVAADIGKNQDHTSYANNLNDK